MVSLVIRCASLFLATGSPGQGASLVRSLDLHAAHRGRKPWVHRQGDLERSSVLTKFSLSGLRLVSHSHRQRSPPAL